MADVLRFGSRLRFGCSLYVFGRGWLRVSCIVVSSAVPRGGVSFASSMVNQFMLCFIKNITYTNSNSYSRFLVIRRNIFFIHPFYESWGFRDDLRSDNDM